MNKIKVNMMENEVLISNRLKQVGKYVARGTFLADIGSDHAYLPVYLCKNDPYLRAIAGEVSLGPLKNAQQNIERHHLSKRIEAKLGNGLDVVDERIDEVTICGMGGSLIATILENGQDKLKYVHKIIAQPNNQEKLVRKKLLELGFNLSDEMIMEENGHIYEIIIATRNDESCYNRHINQEIQHVFGPKLMQEQTETFKKKWHLEKKAYKRILKQLANAKHEQTDKIKEINEMLKQIEEVVQFDET